MKRFHVCKREKVNPVYYLVKRMWNFGEGRRGAIIASMVMSAIGMAIWLVVPLVMARFIGAAQSATQSRELGECVALLAATVGLGILGWMVHGPCRVVEILSGFSVRKNIQTGLLVKATRLPLKWQQATTAARRSIRSLGRRPRSRISPRPPRSFSRYSRDSLARS